MTRRSLLVVVMAAAGFVRLSARHVYDPKADPFADLRDAIRIAKADKKRILLIAGGDWCVWCHRMTEYIHDHREVADRLKRFYVVVHVNVSDENSNPRFLAQYPKAEGYPHFYVLESDGSFLHSQGTGPLLKGKSYHLQRFIEFLDRWSVPSPSTNETAAERPLTPVPPRVTVCSVRRPRQ